MIDIDRILLELEMLPEYDTQIMLQGINESKDHTYGIGRLADSNHPEEDFKYPLFELPYTNSVIEDLNMRRTRVMRMPSKYCYSYHRDPTMRMHIPLITNDDCFFVIEDEVIRLPADGNHYTVDTRKKHTFVNASFEERIHIVGVLPA